MWFFMIAFLLYFIELSALNVFYKCKERNKGESVFRGTTRDLFDKARFLIPNGFIHRLFHSAFPAFRRTRAIIQVGLARSCWKNVWDFNPGVSGVIIGIAAAQHECCFDTSFRNTMRNFRLPNFAFFFESKCK